MRECIYKTLGTSIKYLSLFIFALQEKKCGNFSTQFGGKFSAFGGKLCEETTFWRETVKILL